MLITMSPYTLRRFRPAARGPGRDTQDSSERGSERGSLRGRERESDVKGGWAVEEVTKKHNLAIIVFTDELCKDVWGSVRTGPFIEKWIPSAPPWTSMPTHS